ncbi:GtrA family protein [Pusillimonas sp.]|uniref:GtrA family protein n=1 Tax=Pusillimonas sp. TaxID=3040095 RepID=UPI0029A91B9C|nr:GtrA family protein [Pusillimonas sp.]MDX3895335.1 GtrA family protein [Pusillimonas sp.]
MTASAKLAVSYAIFALIATIANIGAQDLVIRIYPGPFGIFVSIAVGTVVGLVVKYVLDKRYIFRFRTQNATHNVQTFALYSVMGVATTIIFWGFESGFHHIWQTREMRYLGATIGLAIGYLAKYHLDKRYVFRSEII